MNINKFRYIFYSILVLVLAFSLYFRSNAKDIYAHIGNFNYQKNNLAQAQKYYEKSISLGNKDLKIREKYINSIINSPLTIESQEKLVQIAESENDDIVSGTAEYFLYNLKREIHNKYPKNYVKQAPYNQQIIHWGKMPITYTFRHTDGVPQNLVKEVNNAFDEWQRVSSCRIIFQRVITPKADIVVDFDTNKLKDLKENSKYVIAYTMPVVYENKLREMDMKFNVYNLNGEYYTPNQIYNTALHEIFHALGFMGHSYDKENVMYMSAQTSQDRFKISDADKSTLELLYKIKPDITNADKLEYEYIPYLVLGDNKDVNYTKTREAKNYIRRAPNLPGGYIDLAETLVAEKQYAQAIKHLEKALSLARDEDTKYIVYYNLSVSYFYIGNYEMTLDYIQKAQKINDTEELHYIAAETYLKINDYKSAIKEYKYLTKLMPQNIDYSINLINIYIKLHQYFNARAEIKNFVKNNPQEKNNSKFKIYGILRF